MDKKAFISIYTVYIYTQTLQTYSTMNRYRNYGENKTCLFFVLYYACCCRVSRIPRIPPFAETIMYSLFGANLTILIWNPDTVPFSIVAIGLRIPFMISRAIKTADNEAMSKAMRYSLIHSIALFMLGVLMNFYNWLNPCLQYAGADDPCKNTNIFEDYKKSNITANCDTFSNDIEVDIQEACRRAWFLRTASIWLIASILFVLSSIGLWTNFVLDKREKEQEDDGTDNIQEQLDLEEFSWGNNQVFPRRLLVRR